jgi:large subunit ribosomal protein L13
MKTYSPKPSEVPRRWHVLDADGQPLGRLATRAATLLRGKHKPQFAPHLPIGDYVIIINAAKVRVTGTKTRNKIYYRHTQHPGGLRATAFKDLIAKHPTRPVERAVRGMLPRNKLGRRLFTYLKVYPGPEHPHQAQLAAAAATGEQA